MQSKLIMRLGSIALVVAGAVIYVCSSIWRDPQSFAARHGESAAVGADERRTIIPPSSAGPIEKRRGIAPISSGTAERSEKQIRPATTSYPRSREEALRVSAQRADVLRSFFAERSRDAWAAQTEIELRQTVVPEGIALQEVSCRAAICRLLFTGGDTLGLFEAVSKARERSKTFAREVSSSDGVVTVEAFISPSGTSWPSVRGS